MKLLIAGFGDLGQTLAQTCLNTSRWAQAPILAIRRQRPNDSALPHVTWIEADLSKPDSLSNLAEQAHGVTHVVYCAAPSERSESAYRATYVTGLQNLVAVLKSQDAHRIKQDIPAPQFLFVSSTAVYDSEEQGIVDESTPTAPRGFNGKILLEAETWLLAHWPGALIFRLSGIYGPNKQSLLRSIANGTASAPDSSAFIANRIHIEDAARAILHLFEHRHEGIFIGTDSHPLPLTALYRQLAQMLGAQAPSTGAPSPMMGKKQLSNQKLLSTGFALKWPDCIEGYRALIAARQT